MDTFPDLRSIVPGTGPTPPCVQPERSVEPGPNDVLDAAAHAGRRDSPVPGGHRVDPAQEGWGGNFLGGGLTSESLQEEFQALPEPWREVLWHMDLNKVPAHEAARLLGLNLPGVKGLHRRATTGLLERLQQPTKQPDHTDSEVPLVEPEARVGEPKPGGG